MAGKDNETPYWVTEIRPTPIGPLGLAVSQHGLAYVELDGLADLKKKLPGCIEDSDLPSILEESIKQIREYLDGKRKVFDLPLDLGKKTTFTLQVLEACRAIPYGEISTYGELARQVNHPGAARAVGSVMASNPIPLIIPCHRVVGSEGGLHGFGAPGGLDTKSWLLQMEQVNVSGYRVNPSLLPGRKPDK